MKVLFIKDLRAVAQKDTIKDVKDGYAQSFLIPRGYAIVATAQKIKEQEAKEKE
jgi:large subunit ribosomal protein L9